MTDLATIPFTEMTREQFQDHLDERSVNTHDAARVATFFSEEGIQRRVATGEVARGRTAIRDLMQQTFTAFPDCHLEVLDLFSTDDRMCVRCLFTGSHHGELLGIPPTHRGVEFETCLVLRIGADGLVEEEVIYADSATIFGQLGIGS